MSCELLARGGNRSAATRPGTKVVTTRGGRRLWVLCMRVCRVYTAIIIMCSESKLKVANVNLVPRSSEHHSSLLKSRPVLAIREMWFIDCSYSGQTPLGPPLSVQEASILPVGMAMHTWAAKDNEAAFSDLSVAESSRGGVQSYKSNRQASALSSRFCAVEVLVGLVNHSALRCP